MTGSIQSVGNTTLPVAVGDPLTWTLRYDRSARLTGTGPGGAFIYNETGPLLSDIVDGRSGFHASAPAWIPANVWLTSGGFLASDFQTSIAAPGTNYDAALLLSSIGPLPTTSLAALQLDHVPFHLENTSPSLSRFTYTDSYATTFSGFMASVTSLSLVEALEPSTLTLFALGTLGLTLRCFRRRTGCPGQPAGSVHCR